jgi:putative oxidoreductase
MTFFMRRFDSETYALMRIVTGFLFLWHGAQKLFGFPQAAPTDAPAFILYVAGPIEFVGGILVAVGLFTRWAAFICSGLMASAYWMAHGTKHALPLLNGGELAALYCFVFLFISAYGAGLWSVDAARDEATSIIRRQ